MPGMQAFQLEGLVSLCIGLNTTVYIQSKQFKKKN